MRKMPKSPQNGYLALIRRRAIWILVPSIILGCLPLLLVDKSHQDTGIDSASRTKVEHQRLGESAGTKSVAPLTGIFPVEQWKLHLFGVLAGALIGISAVIFAELKKPSLREEIDLARLTGIPVLVSIPKIQREEPVARRRA